MCAQEKIGTFQRQSANLTGGTIVNDMYKAQHTLPGSPIGTRAVLDATAEFPPHGTLTTAPVPRMWLSAPLTPIVDISVVVPLLIMGIYMGGFNIY